MGLIINLDNIFNETLPKEVFENAKKLNNSSLLKMSEDNNTSFIILKKFFSDRNFLKIDQWFATLVDLIVNTWVFFINNFKIIIFNYFGHMICILV